MKRAINIARIMRRQATKAEKIFWDAVRNRRFKDLKVRRQYPVSFRADGRDKCFIADFYIPAYRTIIELDGAVHDSRQEYDRARDALLKDMGFHVLRFSNEAVEFRLDETLKELAKELSYLPYF